MIDDEKWMLLALAEASRAAVRGDIPIGAVIVRDGTLLAADGNRRSSENNPLAHAEVLVIEQAAKSLESWRLDNCTLYVTIEPCPMCAGAIVESRVKRLVFGAREPRSGAARSCYQLLDDPRRTHRLEVTENVEADAAKQLLQSFFVSRRR